MTRAAVFLIMLALSPLALIAQSDQDVYEHFRAWFGQQPPEVQRGDNVENPIGPS